MPHHRHVTFLALIGVTSLSLFRHDLRRIDVEREVRALVVAQQTAKHATVYTLQPSQPSAFVRPHTPGTIDRAVRFMITTGRPEFSEQVWPLISSADNQVHLEALCAAGRFRPSLLGDQRKQRLRALPDAVRKNVLHEIASNSGFDGMELATELAEADPVAEVVIAVVQA